MALAVASIFDAMIRLRPDATATLARLADAVTLGELGPGAFVGIIRRELGPTVLLQALISEHPSLTVKVQATAAGIARNIGLRRACAR